MPATVSDRAAIEAAYADLDLLGDATDAVRRTIAALDRGEVRVAEPVEGEWVVNEWVKQAILLYFRVAGLETIEAGPFEYHDKIPTKRHLAEAGIRVVPPGTVRYGAFCEPGVVVMPGYVNIGAMGGVGDDGRHLGNRGVVRPGGSGRPPVRRGRDRRGPGAAVGRVR